MTEFGPFTVDSRAFELRRKGQRVPISPSLMKLLVLFIEHPGELITRERIAGCLWDQPEYVDVDNGINTAIRRLRSILGDNPAKPVYLETVIGLGYRFKMPVRGTTPPVTVSVAALSNGQALPAEPVQDGQVLRVQAPEPFACAVTLGEEGFANTGSGVTGLPAADPPPILVDSGNSGAQTAAVPGRASTLRRVLPFLGAACLGAGLLTAALYWRPEHGHTTIAQRTRVAFAEATFNNTDDPVETQAISRGGRWLAYTDRGGLFTRELSSSLDKSLSLPATFKPKHITWRPDDSALIVSGIKTTGDGGLEPQVWLVPAAGDAARLLLHDASEAVPSMDGKHLAYVAEHGTALWVSGPLGDSPRLRRKVGPEFALSSVEWAPESNRLIFDECRNPSLGDTSFDLRGNLKRNCNYQSIEAATGELLASEQDVPYSSAFLLPDGRLYFSRDVVTEELSRAGLFFVRTDKTTGRFLDAPKLVVRMPGDRVFGVSASDDGRLMSALIQRRSSDVFVGDLTSPGPHLTHIQRLDHVAPDNYPHGWMPDNEQVIYESDDAGDYAVYRQAANMSAPELIARSQQNAVFPQLSPDHRFVLFENVIWTPEPVVDALFQLPLTGGAIRRLPMRGRIVDFMCPSARTSQEDLTCVVREKTGNDLVFYRFDPVHGEGPRIASMPAANSRVGDWSISSDGKVLALPGSDPGHPEIQLISFSQHGAASHIIPVRLPETGVLSSVEFSPGGEEFYVQVRTGTGCDLMFVDRSGRATLLRQTFVPTWGVPSLDGKKLAFVDQTSTTNAWVGEIVGPESSVGVEQPVNYVSLRSLSDPHGF